MKAPLDYLVVAAGGALGACLRYFIGGFLLARTQTPFPLATFIINVSGSFIIGFFLTLATERLNVSPHLRLAIAVGFVGAYTTFSTFEYETIRLIEEGHLIHAVLNVVLSIVVGFAAVWGGIAPAFRNYCGNSRQRLALRSNPMLECEGSQLRLLLDGFVQMPAVDPPHIAQIQHPDNRQRQGDADCQYQ